MSTLIHERLGKPRHRGPDQSPTPPAPAATGEHPHPGRVFLCLLWKEYRQLRALWILLAVIIASIAGLMAIRIVIPNATTSWNLIFLIPGLFSLSAGSMFFANEREQGTDKWLTQWTVPPLLLILGKYAVAICGTVTLGLLGAILVYELDLPRELPNGRIAWTVAVCSVGVVFSYLWSSAASVITGRVLTSATIGAAMTMLATYFAGAMLELYLRELPFHHERRELAVSVFVLALLCLISMIATLLLFVRAISGKHLRFMVSRSTNETEFPYAGFRRQEPPRSVISALYWKERRQSGRWIIGVLVYMAGFVLFVTWPKAAMIFAHVSHHGVVNHLSSVSYGQLLVDEFGMFLISAFMWLPYLFGSLSFASDQRGRNFRFLTNQGVNPGVVWVPKQLIWLSLLLLWIPVMLVTSFYGAITWLILWSPFAALTAFATVQLSALLIPQTIVAIAIGVCMNAILLYYSLAMTELHVPFLLLAVPMPLVLLAASFLLTRSWMEERTGWRQAAWKAGVIAGPLALLFVGVCLFRAYEIPSTNPKDLLPTHVAPATPGQVATANAYAEIVKRAEPENREMLNHTDDNRDLSWDEGGLGSLKELHNTKSLVGDLVAITKRPEGMLTLLDPGIHHEWIAERRERMEFRLLSGILIAAAKEHEKERNWDKAKEHYLAMFGLIHHAAHRAHRSLRREIELSQRMAWAGILHWAKQPSTTVPEIIAAIEQLKREAVVSPELFKEIYLTDFDLETSNRLHPMGLGMFDVTYYYTPWERARADRLRDFTHKRSLDEIQALIVAPPRTLDQSIPIPFSNDQYGNTWYGWVESTPISILIPGDSFPWAWEWTSRHNLAALAVIAWKKDHGKLPQDLQMACRDYLGAVPTWHGKPFRLFVRGNRFQILPDPDKVVSWNEGEGWSVLPDE